MSKRPINVDNMSEEAFEGVVQQVGIKVSEILNAAKAESDKLLARYSLAIELSYNLKSIGTTEGE
jgi:hypothetical protein